MGYETVIWEQTGGVGRLTLNRPETLNAWTAQFGTDLKHVIKTEAADDSVRAVLVTGAGRGFSSGADLKAGFEREDVDGYAVNFVTFRQDIRDPLSPIKTRQVRKTLQPAR